MRICSSGYIRRVGCQARVAPKKDPYRIDVVTPNCWPALASTTNFSAVKFAMSAPQPSVDQFHLWCDDLPEPVVLASREGEILAANPRFSRFAGSRKILGCQLSEFSPASADAVDRYIEACAAAQGPVQGSLLLRDETGAEVTYPCLGRAMDFSLPSAGRYVLVRLLPAAEPFPPARRVSQDRGGASKSRGAACPCGSSRSLGG